MPSLSLPLNGLTYFLSFSFTMAGLSKLVPSHPMYNEMVAKSTSWLTALHVPMSADQLRVAIGASELVLGLLLVGVPAAAYGLIFIMIGALLTHYRLDGGVTNQMAPAGVLLLCLVIRNVLYGIVKETEVNQQVADADRERKND